MLRSFLVATGMIKRADQRPRQRKKRKRTDMNRLNGPISKQLNLMQRSSLRPSQNAHEAEEVSELKVPWLPYVAFFWLNAEI